MNSPYKGKFKVSQQYKGSLHDGLDLVGLDSKEIYSTVDGIVEKAGWEDDFNHQKGFGLYLRIKQSGSSDKYYFGHLSKVFVRSGDAVKKGDLIAVEGSSGYSTGSHCHYCARGNGLKSEIRDICAISGIPNEIGTYIGSGNEKTDFIYKVKVGGKWLSEVKNLEDFAGIEGKAITDIAVKATKGTVKYRVHVCKGKWLPYVTGYDINDYNNGYAGNGKAIDAVEIIYADGTMSAQYRVSSLNKAYYSWQTNNQKLSGQDGYAGLFGHKIDRLQITVK